MSKIYHVAISMLENYLLIGNISRFRIFWSRGPVVHHTLLDCADSIQVTIKELSHVSRLVPRYTSYKSILGTVDVLYIIAVEIPDTKTLELRVYWLQKGLD